MNTKVHPLIVKAALDLVTDPIKERLRTQILTGDHKGYTYLELIMLGAKLEDDANTPCEIADPEVKHWLLKKTLVAETGPYQHWVEHFWNTKLTKGKGLVIDSDYICGVVEEAIGLDYFKPLFGDCLSDLNKAIASAITKAIEGSTVLGSYRSAPERAQDYWELLLKQYAEGNLESAYINLGRVCHLLADMATPAHVHGDPHAGFSWVKKILDFLDFPSDIIKVVGENTKVDDDDYEDYTGSVISKCEDPSPNQMQVDMDYCKRIPDNWNVDATCRAVFKTDWELFDYFKDMASYAAQYDSDDVDGTKKTHPYHWTHLRLYDATTWDVERDLQDDLTDYACNAMAEDLIPSAIMHTAGLLDYFFYTVGDDYLREALNASLTVTADKITVHDDTDPFASGEIYLKLNVAGQTKRSKKISAEDGDTISLKKHNLTYQVPFEKKPLYISSSAYDDDSFLFINDTESLGSFSDSIPYTSIESSQPYTYVKRSSMGNGSAGKYTLTCTIKKNVKEQIKATRKLVTAADGLKKEQLNSMKKTRYKMGSTLRVTPVLLNGDSMNRHFPTQKHKLCGHFKKAVENGTSHVFYMYENELFQKFPNSLERSLHLAAKHFGDTSGSIEEVSERYKTFVNEDKALFHLVFKNENNDNNKLLEKIRHVNEDNFSDSFQTKCNCCNDELQYKLMRMKRLNAKPIKR